MINTVKIMLIILSTFLISVGCLDNSSDKSNDENHATTKSDIYGSYWGKVTISGTDYNICLHVRKDKVAIYSTLTSMSTAYTHIAYSHDTKDIWSLTTYSDKNAEQSGTASCTGTFTLNDETQTCIATIVSMNLETDTLTLGDDYQGEYGYIKSDLYGSYRGNLNFSDSLLPMCLDMREDSVHFLSGYMSVKYPIVEYTQADDGTWSFATYWSLEGDPRCEGSFSWNGSALTCVVVIHPMSDATSETLVLGDDYSGIYDSTDELYGSYWGTYTCDGTDYEMCLVFEEDSISFYSSNTQETYTNNDGDDKRIKYSDELTQAGDGSWKKTWYWKMYSDSGTAYSGSFTVKGDERTTVALFSDGTTSNILTLGDDYDGEFDDK